MSPSAAAKCAVDSTTSAGVRRARRPPSPVGGALSEVSKRAFEPEVVPLLRARFRRTMPASLAAIRKHVAASGSAHAS